MKRIPSIGFPGKTTQFLKLVYNGKKASLYTYKFYLPSMGNTYIDKKETYYYIEMDGKLKYIRSDRFRKIMITLFKDNEKLVEMLKNRKFALGNILELVKQYNE